MHELVPLSGKSRVIRAAREGHNDPNRSKLLEQAKQVWSIYIDVEKIREMYGEECAIYFKWMNFFLKWLLVPGILAIPIYILNCFVFEVEKSPASAFFSLLMSFWGTLFTINWRRHQRGLDILWTDYVSFKSKPTIRKEFEG